VPLLSLARSMRAKLRRTATLSTGMAKRCRQPRQLAEPHGVGAYHYGFDTRSGDVTRPSMNETLGYGSGNSLMGFLALAFVPFPTLFYRYGEWFRTRTAVKFREPEA
jgi:hypothetical protein